MTDLAAQILAALDRAESVVLDGWDSDGEARIASMWTGGEPGYTTVASDAGDNRWIADGHEVEDPRHVQVMFDPAHVLRLCAALREVVKLADEATSMDMSLDQEFATKPRDGVGDPYLGDRFLAALASVWDVPGVAE